MQSADNRPVQIRQEAAERVAAAKHAYLRSTNKLVFVAILLGALIGFGVGLLVAERWNNAPQVIVVPTEGIEV